MQTGNVTKCVNAETGNVTNCVNAETGDVTENIVWCRISNRTGKAICEKPTVTARQSPYVPTSTNVHNH